MSNRLGIVGSGQARLPHGAISHAIGQIDPIARYRALSPYRGALGAVHNSSFIQFGAEIGRDLRTGPVLLVRTCSEEG